MDKKTYDKTYKRLMRTFVASLILLLFVFFLKQVVIRYQIAQEVNTSYIINIAGRQRMLSQKIAKDLVRIHTREPSEQDDQYRSDLASSLKLWGESHQELLDFNKTSRAFEDMEEIRQMFKQIQPSFTKIVEGAEGFLLAIENGQQGMDQLAGYVDLVMDNEEVFLEQMDAIVFTYDAQATKSVQAIQKTHTILLILILIIGFFMTSNIIVPLFKYLDHFNKTSTVSILSFIIKPKFCI